MLNSAKWDDLVFLKVKLMNLDSDTKVGLQRIFTCCYQ
jgi:hypothetical protein